MAEAYLTVEDNTAPYLQFTLKRNGLPIDLTGASAILIIKSKSSGLVTNTGHQTCTVTSATGGIIRYTRAAVDIPIRGTFICEVRVTYSDSTVEVIYEQLTIIAREKIT